MNKIRAIALWFVKKEYFWYMHPELFQIGSMTIHTYGFMIMLGAIVGYWFMSTMVKKELGIEPDKIQNLAILMIVAAFIGGKLFSILKIRAIILVTLPICSKNLEPDLYFMVLYCLLSQRRYGFLEKKNGLYGQ